MNKRGLVGKILLILGLIILVLGIIIGITAYQAYSLYTVVNEEALKINTSITEFQKGDCTQIDNILASANRIESKAISTCSNPIIRIAVDKMPQIPIKCTNITSLKSQMETAFAPIKSICANMTAANITLKQ